MWHLLFLTFSLANLWAEQDLSWLDSDNLPQQVKLAWTGNPGQLMVAWVTFTNQPSQLRIRPVGTSDYTLIYGTSTQFSKGLFAYQYIHSALVKNLTHNKNYQYFVGKYPYISKTFNITFYQKSQCQTLAAFGDWGTGGNGKPGLNHLQNNLKTGIQGILHFGDIAYDLHDDFGDVGDSYFREIEPISSQVPYMFTPGNHQDHSNFTQVVNRLRMIKNQGNQGTGLFFSFDIKYAHIVMLNAQVYFRDGGDEAFAQTQYNWLVQDLKQANLNREERPWLIVMSHHPMYCSTGFIFCIIEGPIVRDHWEDLFYNQTVDLYLSGHVHWYERDTAIYKDKAVAAKNQTKNSMTDAGATVHILSGIMGSHEGKNTIPSELEPWAEVVKNQYGYGVLKIASKTSLEWVQYDAENNLVADTFVLNKTSPRPF